MTLHDVVSAEALDKETVRYTFKGTLMRDLPIIVAQLPVLSKAYYTKQPFDETSLKPPLGSGPYKIKAFNPGTDITYTRRDDYWAKDLPVNRGRYNFDEIRYDYYRDRNIELEALKSGQLRFPRGILERRLGDGLRHSRRQEGRLIKTCCRTIGRRARKATSSIRVAINSRIPRVRAALDLVFDFEWSNKKLFYGLYKRTTSYFENSDMKATGKPSPEELALLDPYKDKLSPEVFGEPYTPPVTDGSGNNRDNLKKARDLLIAAGWKPGPDHYAAQRQGRAPDDRIPRIRGDVRTHHRALHGELKRKIGVDASWRLVDPAPIRAARQSLSISTSTTQRYSLAADARHRDAQLLGLGSREDRRLVQSGRHIGSRGRRADRQGRSQRNHVAELVTATRAIDRVLRAGHYWVPHWYKASYRIAYWNKFSRPAVQPKYDAGMLDTWWFDPVKAAALSSGKPHSAVSGTTGETLMAVYLLNACC